MKHLLIFVENYVAGGADKMARLYADNLGAKKATLFYNHDDDTSVLLANPISPSISSLPYSFPTLANLGSFANRFKNLPPLYIFLKVFNLLVRYPLWIVALFYFFFKFIHLKPTHFIINNGGYPGGEWCRVATVSAKLYSLYTQIHAPILHIVHNRATKPFCILFAPIEYFIDLLIDKCSKIICVSHENAKTLKTLRYIKQEIEVIHTGVQINTLKQYPPLIHRPLKLLNVASLYSVKNQLCILQALSSIDSKNIELHLVGKEGEEGYETQLREYAQKHDLNVFFHGFCPPQKFYQECDVFILSSLVEGFPLVTLEAMSFGMPIISTKCGGTIEQLIDNYNSLLIESDPLSITKSIEFFLKNPNKIEEMGKNAYKHIEKHFAFDKMVEKYKRLIS